MTTENTTNKPVGRAGNPEGGPVKVQVTIPGELNAEIIAFQKMQKDMHGTAPISKAEILIYLAWLYFSSQKPSTLLPLAVLALASGCDRGALSGMVTMLFVAASVYAVGHLLLSLLENQQDHEETN